MGSIVLMAVAIVVVAAWAAFPALRESPWRRHFKESEFRCPCCGKADIDPELIRRLEILRRLCGNRPIMITSGYRCAKHNAEVGGAHNSQHVKGQAADIKVKISKGKYMDPERVAVKAREAGFTFVKVYPTWTHCDIRREADK